MWRSALLSAVSKASAYQNNIQLFLEVEQLLDHGLVFFRVDHQVQRL
jgi:hypothetical protein